MIDLTPYGARVVLGSLREIDYQPGGFENSLVHTMMLADMTNLHRLSFFWPELGAAVHAYKNIDGGLDALRDIATRSTP